MHSLLLTAHHLLFVFLSSLYGKSAGLCEATSILFRSQVGTSPQRHRSPIDFGLLPHPAPPTSSCHSEHFPLSFNSPGTTTAPKRQHKIPCDHLEVNNIWTPHYTRKYHPHQPGACSLRAHSPNVNQIQQWLSTQYNDETLCLRRRPGGISGRYDLSSSRYACTSMHRTDGAILQPAR